MYNLCTSENDFSNLQKVLIYTTGNENGQQAVNVDNLQGLSFFKYNNGYLEHSFYKKVGGTFVKVDDLTLKCRALVSMDIVDFVVQYSEIITSQLSVYIAQNPNYTGSFAITPSNEFKDFMIYDFGSHMKLQGTTTAEVGRRREPTGACGPCLEVKRGDCIYEHNPAPGYYDTHPAEGFCDISFYNDNGDCQYFKSQAVLQGNSEYEPVFNTPKTYEIRDELEKSVFGRKYSAYYYQTSFYELDFTLQESIQFASLLPKIYGAYDKYKSNEDEAILIDDAFASELTNVIQGIRTKNTNRKYFVKILDDIIDDINFIKNKNVGEIKSKVF